MSQRVLSVFLFLVTGAAGQAPGLSGVEPWWTPDSAQVATAAAHGWPVAGRNALGIELALSPAGIFVQATEVSAAQWAAVRGEEPPEEGSLPAAALHWLEALAWCNALSSAEGLQPLYDVVEGESLYTVIVAAGKAGYRLPTEAEWEQACRAGTTTDFATGERLTREQARVDQLAFAYEDPETAGMTVAVGSFPPNGWGLYDLHGNVAEWCGGLYTGAELPRGHRQRGAVCAVRGGNFLSPPAHARSGRRAVAPPEHRDETLGFRVVLDPGLRTRPDTLEVCPRSDALPVPYYRREDSGTSWGLEEMLMKGAADQALPALSADGQVWAQGVGTLSGGGTGIVVYFDSTRPGEDGGPLDVDRVFVPPLGMYVRVELFDAPWPVYDEGPPRPPTPPAPSADEDAAAVAEAHRVLAGGDFPRQLEAAWRIHGSPSARPPPCRRPGTSRPSRASGGSSPGRRGACPSRTSRHGVRSCCVCSPCARTTIRRCARGRSLVSRRSATARACCIPPRSCTPPCSKAPVTSASTPPGSCRTAAEAPTTSRRGCPPRCARRWTTRTAGCGGW